MSIICEESHLCFGEEPEPTHKISHLCFGKRYRPQLDQLEARAVASVLENAVDQLTVLGKTLPEIEGDWNENFRDLEVRFGQQPPLPKKYPEMAGRWPSQTEALLKVQRDRQFCGGILDAVLAELRDTGSFSTLRTSLDWHSAMIADEHKLLEQHEEELLGGLSISYANAWEHNRREQQGLVLGHKEDTLHDAIERIQDPDGPNEERIHTEVMRFLEKDTEILRKDLDHWTDLYDAEMMQRETENMQLKSKLEQQKEERRELVEEDRRRIKIVREAAGLRAQYEEKKTVMKSIIAIQAWWRGVSFRAGIRTTKPKKDKKKKKKKRRKGKIGQKGTKKKGKGKT